MIRVLIVEDEPALARGLSLLITKNYTDFEVLGICKMAEMDFRISWSWSLNWYLRILPCL